MRPTVPLPTKAAGGPGHRCAITCTAPPLYMPGNPGSSVLVNATSGRLHGTAVPGLMQACPADHIYMGPLGITYATSRSTLKRPIGCIGRVCLSTRAFHSTPGSLSTPPLSCSAGMASAGGRGGAAALFLLLLALAALATARPATSGHRTGPDGNFPSVGLLRHGGGIAACENGE